MNLIAHPAPQIPAYSALMAITFQPLIAFRALPIAHNAHKMRVLIASPAIM